MMARLLFVVLMAAPWVGCLALLSGMVAARRGRGLIGLVAGFVAAGSLTLAILQQEPMISLGSGWADAGRASVMVELEWSADRYSLVMIAAIMTILAAATALLPDESSSSWTLTLLITGGLLQLWWLQPVWGIVGIAVIVSFLALVLPTTGHAPGLAGAARSLWLSTTVGDIAFVVAIIAGIGALNEGFARTFSDPATVRDFAVMRPATGMFVAFWWWLGCLCRTGLFPLCVTFDAVRKYPPLAWVMAVGFGVFVMGWRWCDLGQAWWAASPSVFNLVVSGALASAFLCAWFGMCTADFRVRIAYLTAAHISLAIGPLATGNDVDRVWASAVVMGTLGLAVWCWCMVTAPVTEVADEDASSGPVWAKIMTGGEVSAAVWQWSMVSRPPVPPVLPTLAPAARPWAGVIVFAWCGLSIAAGSWWWLDEPLAEAVPAVVEAATAERTGDPIAAVMPVRPNTSIPLSAMAVALVSAAVCAGMRRLLREPGSTEMSLRLGITSLILASVPTAMVIGLARPGGDFANIAEKGAPALACLAFAALVVGWVWAGWPEEQQQRAAASFALVQRLGEQRLRIPGLLQFGANFPLRGLAQMFRFLDWSVLEFSLWGGLRNLPAVTHRFVNELRAAGNDSFALVVWVSGTALVTTIVWLARTAH